jgi:hypothetical protein
MDWGVNPKECSLFSGLSLRLLFIARLPLNGRYLPQTEL